MRARPRVGLIAGAGCFCLLALLGCSKSKPSQGEPVAVGSVMLPALVASGLPIDPRQVSAAVNPKAEPPYSGATGTIRGSITAKGDEAPRLERLLAQVPADCPDAKLTYERLFREGPGRTLADAVVGVTGYAGYVPEERVSVRVLARGCAWNTRTVVLTYGQRLEVLSQDQHPYVPDLLGQVMHAQLVAVPGGDPISLYPEQPGRYVLTDSMRLFMTAEVMVVKFATHAVTALDGRFEIRRIPAGKVVVSAFLPATLVQAEKQVELKADQILDVDFELGFDVKTWVPPPAREAASAASPSASSVR